jgi:hypothetical protein
VDRRGGQQPLDFGHRRHQPVALALVEGGQDGGGRIVFSAIALLSLW